MLYGKHHVAHADGHAEFSANGDGQREKGEDAICIHGILCSVVYYYRYTFPCSCHKPKFDDLSTAYRE